MSWWPFNNSKPVQRDFVKEYLKNSLMEIPGIRLFDQLSFVVLDTETTGLNPEIDHVLSFGAVKINSQSIQVASAVEWYLSSSKKGKEAIQIHELIGNKTVLSLADFSSQFLNYIGNNIIVGHHLGFDLEMLKKIVKAFGLTRFPNPCLDTMNLAIRLDYGLRADRNLIPLKNYTLDALCDRYGIKTEDRHTAGGDAFLTANLLLKLLKAAEKKGINNWSLLNK